MSGTSAPSSKRPASKTGDARRLPLAPTLAALLALFVGSVVLAGALGGSRFPLPVVARAFAYHIAPRFVAPPAAMPSPLDPTQTLDGPYLSDTLWQRVPRIFLAALVGASLALAGAALQGILGNPLADPYTVGVSSGASVGAGVALLLGIDAALHGLALPLCAFAAALLTMLLVFGLSRIGGKLQTTGFLLAGIVVGSFLWSVTTLLLSLAGTQQRPILNWLMGRFDQADWQSVQILAPFVLLGFALFYAIGRGLDAFSFGEDTARSVGVSVERFKAGTLALAALLTAVSVSVSGIVGFIGLVVPHLARGLVGPSHRAVLPTSLLLGATLAVLADLLARTLRPGEEIPVGVVTALIGAPFFCVLLRRQMGH